MIAAKAGDLKSRDELVFRFQRLVATLVAGCVTGRPNYWSSFQITFFRMFAGNGIPLKNVAMMLKNDLSSFSKEELFLIGQTAVMKAIERCETNLASTIVICFKEEIHRLIKDPINKCIFSELMEINQDGINEEELLLNIFIDTCLTEEEYLIAKKILEGEKVDSIPEGLKNKLQEYLLP